jgi:hypothetical protein
MEIGRIIETGWDKVAICFLGVLCDKYAIYT